MNQLSKTVEYKCLVQWRPPAPRAGGRAEAIINHENSNRYKLVRPESSR